MATGGVLDDKARGLIEPTRLPHTRLGHYSFQLPDLAGTRHALRDPDDASDDEER